MAGSIKLTVPPELDGERVDRVLAKLLDVSRVHARQLVEAGVTVDGSSAKASDRVSDGATLLSPEPSGPTPLEPEDVAFGVAYEDEDVIVVDKPPGLVVHPGSGNARGTLASGLLYRYPELSGVGSPGRWGLVHRLDRDTSGLLLVGRNKKALDSLTAQIADRTVSRVYLALAHGVFEIPTGAIDAPLGRDPARPTRRAVVPGGKPAITHYEVEQKDAVNDVTYLRVRLETGRTHQIRVHLSAIDHPILGDRLYGSRPSRISSPRVFLHAHQLEFIHPRSGDDVVVSSPLPDDLQMVLDQVEGIRP